MAAKLISESFVKLAWWRSVFVRERPGDIPVVFLHGSYRSSFVWSKLLPCLSPRIRGIAPDRLGYGKSNQGILRWVNKNPISWLLEFTENLGVDQFHLVGESRGGGVAIQFAASYPDRVKSISLVATIGLPPHELPKPDPKPNSGDLMTEWDWFVERSFDKFDTVSEDDKRSFLLDIGTSESYERRRSGALPTTYHEVGLLREIVKIECPALLVWGRQDPVFPAEATIRLASILPNLISVEYVQRARHLVCFEHPETVAEMISDHVYSAENQPV